jgi:hypothetical protein
VEELQNIGIQPGHRVALLALSVILCGFVLELVRRGHLREKYALLWLGTSLFGLAVGVYPDLIVRFASAVRFQMLTALFVFGFVFLLSLVMAFSVIISRLSERNRTLAQEVALLGNRLHRLERTDA